MAGLLGLGVVGFLVLAWLFVHAIDQSLDGTTRVSDYPRLLEDWSAMGLVDHFPKTIPAEAADVSLAALPGVLQGSGYLQLRMKLPPQEVAAILAATKAKAVRHCPGQCPDNIEDPEFWAVPRLVAGNKPEGRFPPDFVVYALQTDGDWNHPTGKGVAVSVTRSEVVYWADD